LLIKTESPFINSQQFAAQCLAFIPHPIEYRWARAGGSASSRFFQKGVVISTLLGLGGDSSFLRKTFFRMSGQNSLRTLALAVITVCVAKFLADFPKPRSAAG
jgi:hypothetical protein